MVLGAWILLLLVLLGVCSLAPGFFIVRRLRWSPLEKVCGSVGLSLLLLYLVAFAIYVLKLPVWSCWIVSGVSGLLGLLSVRDLSRTLSARQVRWPLVGFGFLLLWALLLLGLVRNYSGGGWGGDWLEHYHRTLFFLQSLPVDTVIYGGYTVPARPPMMNMLAAHFLAHCPAGQFPMFQVVFVFLNLLVYLPCCLIMRALTKRGGRNVTVLVCLLAASPMFLENLTYTWTKLLSGFYVVLAVWLYLAGWRKKDPVRTVGAFACLAAGALVHYSTGPFIVFLALHYLVRALRRPGAMWRQLAIAVLVSAAILGTWLAWSVATYSLETTLTSNTSVIASRKAAGGNLVKIAQNAFDTLVPHPFREVSREIIRQQSAVGFCRDYAFLIYQTSFPAAMGVSGGLVVAYLLVRWLLTWPTSPARAQRWFWLLFTVFCTGVGIAVVGERETFGVAHICLPPLVLMGLALLAGSFPRLPRPVRWLVIAGCVVDFAVGILLHFNLQNVTFGMTTVQGEMQILASRGKLLSRVALGNWAAKVQSQRVFWGDWLGDYSTVIQVFIVGLFLLVLGALVREALRAPMQSVPARLPRGTSEGSGPARRKGRNGFGRTGGRTRRRGLPRRGGR